MEYNYGFEYGFPEGMDGAAETAFVGAAGLVTGILAIVWLLAMAFSVVSYVLNAVGMYRIAKRRGIHHAWLAWVPIGSSWLLGSISDHYQYVVKHKTTKRRKVLLTLNIVLYVTGVPFYVAFAALMAVAASATGEMAASIFAVALIAIFCLVMVGVSIASLVFSYMSYYDLFQSSKPGNAVLYLILGILVNVTLPFFVFACGNSDRGMPARRPQQPAAEPVFQPDEPAAPQQEEIPVVEAEVVEDPEL